MPCFVQTGSRSSPRQLVSFVWRPVERSAIQMSRVTAETWCLRHAFSQPLKSS